MRKLPKEGTFVRQIYDVLYKNRGKAVDIYSEVQLTTSPDRTRWSNAIIVLERDYNCYIEMVKNRHYVLKGEFLGRDWVMYDGAPV